MSQPIHTIIEQFDVGDYSYRAKVKFDQDLDRLIFTIHFKIKTQADFPRRPLFDHTDSVPKGGIRSYFNAWVKHYKRELTTKRS